MASQDVKIIGSAEVPWRPIDRKIDRKRWEKDIAAQKKLEDPLLGLFSAISTVFEGNGKPLGVTGKQDVAIRALSDELRKRYAIEESETARTGLQKFSLQDKKQAILGEKLRKLTENGLPSAPQDVFRAYNGEDQEKMREKTGKDYPGWLSQILIDIVHRPENEEARKMLGSLLDINSRDRR